MFCHSLCGLSYSFPSLPSSIICLPKSPSMFQSLVVTTNLIRFLFWHAKPPPTSHKKSSTTKTHKMDKSETLSVVVFYFTTAAIFFTITLFAPCHLSLMPILIAASCLLESACRFLSLVKSVSSFALFPPKDPWLSS